MPPIVGARRTGRATHCVAAAGRRGCHWLCLLIPRLDAHADREHLSGQRGGAQEARTETAAAANVSALSSLSHGAGVELIAPGIGGTEQARRGVTSGDAPSGSV